MYPSNLIIYEGSNLFWHKEGITTETSYERNILFDKM